MRITAVIILSILSMLGNVTAEEMPLNLLSGNYTYNDISTSLLSIDNWHPWPSISNTSEWSELSANLKTNLLNEGVALLDCQWPSLPATLFLEFNRMGNRTNYQNACFQRRNQLGKLVIAECVENKGRFLDEIANGIWAICEETYWGVPAHVHLQKDESGLPDVSEPTVDLFAAETGALLAWTYYLLEDKLDAISPLVNKRIELEIKRRIIDVCLERDDFWWMGLSRVRTVNNWNPWVCSNWLTCVLIIENDPQKRVDSVYKIMRCLDEFINPYPRDGGCDEGPGYWGRAGASLYDCLELLQSATQGKVDIFDEPLIQEMGRYIYRVYVDNGYYINFADASAKAGSNTYVTFRYGKSIKDQRMQGFAAYHFHKSNPEKTAPSFSGKAMGRTLPAIFTYKELLEAKPKFSPEPDYWFYDLEVMLARSTDENGKGLYIAAKGGHNNESHNHNDVGNFIVYSDGWPALIDVGVETYTKKTFSGQRYEIWTMQSAYHNLPVINGIMQHNGRQFKATDVQYNSNKKRVEFELNLTKAYPEDAGVKSWKRKITFNRNKDITLTDQYMLDKTEKPLQYTLMTWAEPTIDKAGIIRIQLANRTDNAAKDILISYTKNNLSVEIEPIEITDGRLKSVWQDKVYRILFTEKSLKQKGENKIKISQ